MHEVTCGTQAVHHIAGAACSTPAWHVAAVGGWPAVGYSLALNAGLPRVVAVIAVTALCHADLRLFVSLNNAMVLQHLQKIDMPPTNLLILRGIKSGTRPDVMQLGSAYKMQYALRTACRQAARESRSITILSGCMLWADKCQSTRTPGLQAWTRCRGHGAWVKARR